MATERVTLPTLTSRSALGWVAGTLVALVAVLVGLAILRPAYAVGCGAVLVALLVLVALVATRRRYLEPGPGRVTISRPAGLGRAVILADARAVRLEDNRGGALHLRIDPAAGRPVRLPVLLLSPYVERSQEPPLLRLLADTVERHSGATAGKVPAQLRRQADHLDAGGAAGDSPLAALTSRGVLKPAQAGGAASGTSLLD